MQWKERKRHPKRSQKGWLVQVVWWMNEWMNECHPDKKKINGAKALSFIPFNMLLICSMIVTKPKQTIFVCVCVKWKKRNYESGSLVWSSLVSIPFSIASRYSVPPAWVILSFFYPEFLRVPCQGKSEHLLLFILRKDTKLHATHCPLPWTTLFISTLLLICTHEWGGGGFKDGIIPLPCPSLITGVPFLFFLGDINFFAKFNKKNSKSNQIHTWMFFFF